MEPSVPWPNTPKENLYFEHICKLEAKLHKFPWYSIGVGFSIASLLWGIIFMIFGG